MNRGLQAKKAYTELTPRRRAILNLIASTDSHPDANWIYSKVRERIPKVSLSTVYRTIQALRELGLIFELPQPSGPTRYDANLQAHHHVICVVCGKIVDVVLPDPDSSKSLLDLRGYVREAAGFLEVNHDLLEFYGRCSSCPRQVGDRR